MFGGTVVRGDSCTGGQLSWGDSCPGRGHPAYCGLRCYSPEPSVPPPLIMYFKPCFDPINSCRGNQVMIDEVMIDQVVAGENKWRKLFMHQTYSHPLFLATMNSSNCIFSPIRWYLFLMSLEFVVHFECHIASKSIKGIWKSMSLPRVC